MPGEWLAVAAVWAHGVLAAPGGRHVDGVGRARHHCPATWRGIRDLEKWDQDRNRPGIHIEDRFDGGHPQHAVPAAAAQLTIDVGLEPSPLHMLCARTGMMWACNVPASDRKDCDD